MTHLSHEDIHRMATWFSGRCTLPLEYDDKYQIAYMTIFAKQHKYDPSKSTPLYYFGLWVKEAFKRAANSNKPAHMSYHKKAEEMMTLYIESVDEFNSIFSRLDMHTDPHIAETLDTKSISDNVIPFLRIVFDSFSEINFNAFVEHMLNNKAQIEIATKRGTTRQNINQIIIKMTKKLKAFCEEHNIKNEDDMIAFVRDHK